MGIVCPLKRQCTCVECFKPVKVVIALCPAVGDIGWDDDDDFFYMETMERPLSYGL